MSTLAIYGFGMAVVAGVLAGGCAAPIKLMRRFQFEHWAFVATLAGQIALPWLLTFLVCPDALSALGSVAPATLVKANVFSFAWGIANVLCGLCLVRIGFSLSVGLLTGIGLPIGVLLPMVFRGSGTFADTPGLATPSGLLIIIGAAVMTAAVFLIAKAGFGRDSSRSGKSAAEGGFRGGLFMAAVAGVLQVGLSFAFVYSQGPICEAMAARGAGETAAGIGVWAATLPGGALVNLAYPMWLMSRKKNWNVLASAPGELALSVAMGATFFLFVIAMGTGMRWMGALGASIGFGVYQAAQISTSQAVGFLSGEWRGVYGRPRLEMSAAIALLLLAVAVIATGRAAG